MTADAVGIDDLNLYAGSLAVEALDVARARGYPESAVARQQLVRRALQPAWEDPVTLAVNAARPVVESAGAGTIELLIVATESGVDYGKPLSSYVHRHLRLPTRCRNVELKHACYGGTAALQLAASWVRAGMPAARRALVITSDVGRRMFGHMAELTEGAGAVAMLVAAAPRVVAFEDRAGYASREVYDVSRPTPTLERGNPELSLAAYLDLLELAWDEYRRGESFEVEAHFANVLYHTPFVGMVEQAHRVLMEGAVQPASHRGTPTAAGATKVSDGTTKAGDGATNGAEHATNGTARQAANASFERLVRPSLGYCQEVGNIYAGSLYAALIGLLDGPAPPVPGARLGLFSYGSGSCAEFYGAFVQPHARAVLARHGIRQQLMARRRVSIDDYEATMCAAEAAMTAADFEPDLGRPAGHWDEAYAGRGRLVLRRVRDYYREYRWS